MIENYRNNETTILINKIERIEEKLSNIKESNSLLTEEIYTLQNMIKELKYIQRINNNINNNTMANEIVQNHERRIPFHEEFSSHFDKVKCDECGCEINEGEKFVSINKHIESFEFSDKNGKNIEVDDAELLTVYCTTCYKERFDNQ